MGQRRRLIVALLAGAAGMALLCGLASALLAPPRASAAERLQAARARWEARPFSGYRLVSRMGECMQRGEFRGATIVRVERQECFDNIRTVESLFSLIERIHSWGLSSPRCAPAGCVCKETRAIEAQYDEALGYPRRVRLHKYRFVDWAALLESPASYRAALECGNPPAIEMISVTELTPLP